MSLVRLQERLTSLQESTIQLKELVDRLANLQFQPGSVPLGTDEEESISGELSAEIGQILKTNAEDQELLLEEVNYVRPEGHEKERLTEGVVRVGNELTKYRLEFRKARLQAKKSLVAAQKLERQLILKSYSSPAPEAEEPFDNDEHAAPAQQQRPQQHYNIQHQNRSIHQNRSGLSDEDQQTVGASSNVTSALRRTHDLIASELSRSEFAHETLTESSAALRQLDDSYGSLDSMLAKSRDLLGTLLRSQKSDTWYLQTAFYMLAVTGAWLVFRRLLYGPVWWLVLFPLRILFGIGSTATRAVLPAGSRSAPAPPEHAGQSAGGDSVKDSVPVQGLPDESLPTAVVDAQEGASATGQVEEAVEEAIAQAIAQAIAEAEAGGQEKQSESADEQPASETSQPAEAAEEEDSQEATTEEQPRHENRSREQEEQSESADEQPASETSQPAEAAENEDSREAATEEQPRHEKDEL